jgi:hypothetical protein
VRGMNNTKMSFCRSAWCVHALKKIRQKIYGIVNMAGFLLQDRSENSRLGIGMMITLMGKVSFTFDFDIM